jgi:hypothetical protein
MLPARSIAEVARTILSQLSVTDTMPARCGAPDVLSDRRPASCDTAIYGPLTCVFWSKRSSSTQYHSGRENGVVNIYAT